MNCNLSALDPYMHAPLKIEAHEKKHSNLKNKHFFSLILLCSDQSKMLYLFETFALIHFIPLSHIHLILPVHCCTNVSSSFKCNIFVAFPYLLMIY